MGQVAQGRHHLDRPARVSAGQVAPGRMGDDTLFQGPLPSQGAASTVT